MRKGKVDHVIKSFKEPIEHWFLCGADGRAVYSHVITKFSFLSDSFRFVVIQKNCSCGKVT